MKKFFNCVSHKRSLLKGVCLYEFINFVDLSIPEIQIVEAGEIAEKVLHESIFAENEKVNLFRQNFHSPAIIGGEAIVIFNNDARRSFSRILEFPDQMKTVEEIDFMLELTNLLVGSCLNSILEQLFNQRMTFSSPELMSENDELQNIAYDTLIWRPCTTLQITSMSE